MKILSYFSISTHGRSVILLGGMFLFKILSYFSISFQGKICDYIGVVCFDLQEVLEQLPEPPAEESTLAALKRLQDLGALDEEDVRRVLLHVYPI